MKRCCANSNRFFCFFLPVLLLLFSCTSQRKLIYLQNDNTALNDTSTFDMTLQAGDIVTVQLLTVNPEAFPGIGIAAADKQVVADNRSAYEKGFVIDASGNLELPYIGSTYLKGLTMHQAKLALADKFKKFIDEPVVILKKLNFKFTILGEVVRPGLYYVPNEKLTFTEALAMAGDLTNFGDRTAIRIFRRSETGLKEIPVDLTKKDVLGGEIKYIRPDDLIYVQAVKRKALANISPGLTVITSIITTLVVVATLIVNTNKN